MISRPLSILAISSGPVSTLQSVIASQICGLCSDTAIKEGDLVKRIGSIVNVPAGKAMLGRVVDALGVPIDGRGALSDHERRRVEAKALDLDVVTQALLNRGARLTEVLKQPQYAPLPIEKQILVIYAVVSGFCDRMPLDKISQYERDILTTFKPDLLQSLKEPQAPEPLPLAEPYTPDLSHTLLDDNTRRAELDECAGFHFVGLSKEKKEKVLLAQVQIERVIEKALLSGGYSQDELSQRSKQDEIRGFCSTIDLDPSALEMVRSLTKRSMGNNRLPQLQELKPKALVTRILIARVKQVYKVKKSLLTRLTDLLPSRVPSIEEKGLRYEFVPTGSPIDS
ncbi:hypothetical protein VNO80_13362 [Phaseolus coccineus]|uniref:ATP synthase alpha subunit C-terminal domain-containing protein n=1 Tax=Phaseolus coccineus TaxID=3886 RepID=A0AAN9RFJ5_PHACN